VLNKELVAASDRAKRFTVSIRTIQRDMDTLNLAGNPAYAQAIVVQGDTLEIVVKQKR